VYCDFIMIQEAIKFFDILDIKK